MVVTIAACAWVAARLYRYGVLLYGQKPGLRQMARIVRIEIEKRGSAPICAPPRSRTMMIAYEARNARNVSSISPQEFCLPAVRTGERVATGALS